MLYHCPWMAGSLDLNTLPEGKEIVVIENNQAKP